MKNIVKRTTLMVRNMETSLNWYEQVMGMTKWYDDQVVLSGLGIPAGSKGDRTHLIIMKCEDPTIGMIGLLQFIDPVMPAPETIPTRVGYGNPTFVVNTDDAAELYRRAVQFGSQIHTGPRDFSIRGADGAMRHLISVCLFDPDGHFYECNQLVSVDEKSD